MKNLQKEHAEWVAKKYPNQPAKIPAVGCLEEAGELVHCILKTEQVSRWGEDTRHKLSDLRVKTVDAIGDCGIYACSLCNAMNWDFEEVWELASDGFLDDDDNALDSAIILVQKAANVSLYPHSILILHHYLVQLKVIAKCLGLNAEVAIKRTWQIVKER